MTPGPADSCGAPTLGYNTATAFSPADAAPLTHRAKMLMMLASAISLLTMVIVAARAVNVLPQGSSRHGAARS